MPDPQVALRLMGYRNRGVGARKSEVHMNAGGGGGGGRCRGCCLHPAHIPPLPQVPASPIWGIFWLRELHRDRLDVMGSHAPRSSPQLLVTERCG